MAASWIIYSYIACSAFILVFSTCPSGWIENDQECFWFGSQKKNWNDAEADCRKHNSYLTSDDNQDKHDFLFTYLNIFHSWRLGHFWLGGNDLAIENHWRWFESGSPLGSATFWDQGQPDGNNSANCMSFYMNANNELVWRDDRCTSNYNYVCEQPATGSTPLPVVG